MHNIKRSPILKLVAAVTVNVGFLLICQQYWRDSGDNGVATGGARAGVGPMPEQVLVQQQVFQQQQQQQQNPLNQQYAAGVDETPLRTFEV